MKMVKMATAIAVIALMLAPLPASSEGEKIKVLVSVSDFLPLVKAVGGSFVEVDSILPPGSDPHSFYVTQETVRQIEGADLIVLANSHLLSYEDNIKTNYPSKEYLDFDDYNASLDSFPGYDENPHGYWLKYDNAVSIAEKIKDKLSEILPDKKDYFDSSFIQFKKQVKNAEYDIINMERENGAYGKTMVASVPGVCYIIQNEGANVGVVLLAEGSGSASGKEIRDIEEKLKKGIYSGIVVPEFMKNAKAGEISEQLSEDTGAPVIYVKFSTSSADESYVNDCYHNAMQFISSNGTGGKFNNGNSYLIPVIVSLLLLVALQSLIIYRLYGIYKEEENERS
ncbi:MAG: hypothetical protein DRN33_03700 [Thermoplasmata archaeon]|jgi:ABC-type Zn uptake system ZnuABC Zn-binding protein ZnuA|nr:MAG: hypothetical protein DRN33_03700 [Thermoplasmata archaeon]